ncbi:MAG: glycosyltransferase, partial [Gemmatimonadetes bacterium]|nr:glycosyltransferase [Gemmatimonadota bacterium]
MVKGVTYGTFRPGPHGEPFPERSMVKRDFEHMAQAGFNSVRTYTVPPDWVLDEAAQAGMRVMVGLAWEQHLAFLDEAGRATAIERRIRDDVSRCAGHPAVLCYAVGNEIPSPIVRWSGRKNVERHIRRLWSATKETDPDGLVAYVNYPSTEYLDLPFLDLMAYNVYLESVPRLSSYIARLQNLAGDRPLLMAELGLDSRRNGLKEQARLVPAQVRAAEEGGCAGVFMFSWTDEWHRGGQDVEDWDFGLTARDRSPKPVLEAVRRSLVEAPEPASGRWPRISVVVAAFNAGDTLEECLVGLEALRYPDYEVIVVDDGSTDDTATIAGRFETRLIRTENRGLSRARNTGIDSASGEIVAFIDADAYPDPEWLTYLALSFERSDFVGMGGPNIAPPDSGMVAACVANAPGGPVHVLRTDHEAEHVPGCNMAFRKWALDEIGGFDPRFRVAGDDVDLCWRIQAQGWRIGFSPGAVVWHHPRQTVAGYW